MFPRGRSFAMLHTASLVYFIFIDIVQPVNTGAMKWQFGLGERRPRRAVIGGGGGDGDSSPPRDGV